MLLQKTIISICLSALIEQQNFNFMLLWKRIIYFKCLRMESIVSYYHILIEVNDHISTIEQTRDLEIFDITEIQPYLHSILLPFFNEQLIELEDENLEFKDVLHLSVKQTLLPIRDLIEEEQKLLPSDTDVTITAYEVFNNRDLSQDVTTIIFDLLDAIKLDPEA